MADTKQIWTVQSVEATPDPEVVTLTLERERTLSTRHGGVHATESFQTLVRTEEAPRVYDEYRVTLERVKP